MGHLKPHLTLNLASYCHLTKPLVPKWVDREIPALMSSVSAKFLVQPHFIRTVNSGCPEDSVEKEIELI